MRHLLRETFALLQEDSQMDFCFMDKNRYLKKIGQKQER